jgi:polyketide synthase 13
MADERCLTDPAQVPARDTLRTVQTILAEFFAETNGTQLDVVEPDSVLTEYAASSVQLLQIHARLEDAFGLQIEASVLFDYHTVAALADYLAGRRLVERGLSCSYAASEVRTC